MATPQTIRINVPAPFPTLVAGAAGIVVEKINGFWTIRPDFTALAQATPPVSQYSSTLIESYNALTGVYNTISLVLLAAAAIAVTPTVVTAAGDYSVLSADTDVLIEKTVSIANNVLLPAAASRNGIPVFIKDGAGVASSYPISIKPNGTEKIDNTYTNSNPLQILNNFGGFWLFPRPSTSSIAGWYVKP